MAVQPALPLQGGEELVLLLGGRTLAEGEALVGSRQGGEGEGEGAWRQNQGGGGADPPSSRKMTRLLLLGFSGVSGFTVEVFKVVSIKIVKAVFIREIKSAVLILQEELTHFVSTDWLLFCYCLRNDSVSEEEE